MWAMRLNFRTQNKYNKHCATEKRKESAHIKTFYRYTTMYSEWKFIDQCITPITGKIFHVHMIRRSKSPKLLQFSPTFSNRSTCFCTYNVSSFTVCVYLLVGILKALCGNISHILNIGSRCLYIHSTYMFNCIPILYKKGNI